MTDYIIIGLLAVNLICLLIFLSKNNNKNNNEMIEKLGKFETDITKSIGDFKFDFSKVLTNDFEYYADGLHEKDHWKDKYERTWMHRRPSIHMPKEAARIWLKVKDVRVERLQDIAEEQALSEGVPDDLDYPISKVYCPRCRGEGLIGTVGVSLGYMEVDCPYCDTAIKRFKNLWNSTIKKSDLDRYGWDANPWVWVIEFERCEKPEGWCV